MTDPRHPPLAPGPPPRHDAASAMKHHRRSDPIPIRIGAVQLTTRGAARYDLRDPYHFMVTLTWPRFFLALLAVDLAINIVFALLYLADPGSIANARPGAFADAFFFSIETLATVGYGTMAPASLYGHLVSSAEILCGLVFTAIMTGLIFARFAKPRAKILFAKTAVITGQSGRQALMIRLGNGRVSLLAEARARLSLFFLERTPDGKTLRSYHDLELVQPELPVFALTWTLAHKIDPQGPLADATPQRLAALDVRLLLSVEARDLSLGAHVFALQDYAAAGIRVGMRYQDAITTDAAGHTAGDLTRLSLIEPGDAATLGDDAMRG
jgi:inward rectifier potassium channel